MFGQVDLRYEEEVDLSSRWPGVACPASRSRPVIDVVVLNGDRVVALLSVCWRFRSNRIQMLNEADAFLPYLRRANPSARFYGVTGEFSAARLEKILKNCAPAHANPAITATVHFNPELVRKGLGENGRIAHLKSLEWLIAETHKW